MLQAVVEHHLKYLLILCHLKKKKLPMHTQDVLGEGIN